jgi:cobalt/nickel transport system ATP-binding protein
MEPELIVCDEPTAGLDHINARVLLQAIDGLHQEGTTVVISTHDVNLAYTWTSQVVLINHGQVLAQGSPAEVLSNSSLLNMAGLEKPWILESWEHLQKTGRISVDMPAPSTREEYWAALSGEPETPAQVKKVVPFPGGR